MTRQHIGIVLTVAGTFCLAFSVKVKGQLGRDLKRDLASTIRRLNLVGITETTINPWLFWFGLLLIAVGAGLQW